MAYSKLIPFQNIMIALSLDNSTDYLLNTNYGNKASIIGKDEEVT